MPSLISVSPWNYRPPYELRRSATIEAVQTLLTTGKMPPAVYSQRCQGYSLYAQCLPQAAARVGRYQEE